MPGARPLVSVILPTYNRGYVLKRAVDSVLAQTYSNLELIVIDDGSTDNTQELLASYSDPRLKVVVPGKNGGPAAARNRGLEVARGDFIAFQDSDDEWLLEKLERQLAHLEAHPDASVSVAGFLCVPFDMEVLGYRGASELRRDTFFLKLICYGNQFSTPAWVIRRSKLDQVGHFDEAMVCWEDWELSMRLDYVGGFIALDEPLHIAFDTRGSVKLNTAAFIPMLEFVMRKHPQWVTPSRRIHAQRYWMMGNWERLGGRMALARRYYMRSVTTDLTFLRPWLTMLRRAKDLFLPRRKVISA